MNFRPLSPLLCLLVGLTASRGFAQHRPPSSHRPEMAAVEQFLGLSDAELDQLTAAIARIRAMAPAERAELLAEIQRYRGLPDAQRAKLRMGWGALPPDLQDAWREMMHSLPNERRTEIQRELQSLSPEARAARRKALVEDYLKAQAAEPRS